LLDNNIQKLDTFHTRSLISVGRAIPDVLRIAPDCCQKLLILDQSHCLIQFSIVQDCAPFSIDFACATCVRFVTHNEFDFTRLKQV